MAGLSQAESSEFFKRAHAKKSGEFRKPSDVAPVEIKWPQELLDRPRGHEVGYNDLVPGRVCKAEIYRSLLLAYRTLIGSTQSRVNSAISAHSVTT